MISRVFQVHSNIAEPELGIRSVTISLWKYIKYDANLAPDVVLVPVFWYILSILGIWRYCLTVQSAWKWVDRVDWVQYYVRRPWGDPF